PFVAGAAILAREEADKLGITLTPAGLLDLFRRTGVQVYDGDDEDDNVPNTHRYYSRIGVAAAPKALREDGQRPLLTGPLQESATSTAQGPDPAAGQGESASASLVGGSTIASIDTAIMSDRPTPAGSPNGSFTLSAGNDPQAGWTIRGSGSVVNGRL